MTTRGRGENKHLRNSLILVLALLIALLLWFGIASVELEAEEKEDSVKNSAESNQEGREDVFVLGVTHVTYKVEMPIESHFPTFMAEVTAYCSCSACCAPYDDGITASGAKVQENRTIAMGRQFPFGTLVMIEGFDGVVFEVQDRGGAIHGNRIDVYMSSHQKALNFGREELQVWVLRYGES